MANAKNTNAAQGRENRDGAGRQGDGRGRAGNANGNAGAGGGNRDGRRAEDRTRAGG